MFLFPLNKIVRSDSERQLSSLERTKCTEIMLEYNFPMFMFLTNSIINIVLGIACIALQIASIILKTPLYFIGTG